MLLKINVLFNGILATMLMRILNNVPRPCAVADFGKLICPAKIKINTKRNAEFKDDNGNGARPLLGAGLIPRSE